MLQPDCPRAERSGSICLNELVELFKEVLTDMVLFAEHASGLKLRRYQEEVARSIVNSVVQRKGLTFVVIFPRQSGKNELQAQIEAYLLTLLSQVGAEIVKVSPTWKPQSLNAMRRLERVLEKNVVAREWWKKEQGYIYRVGQARIFFLSGQPGANIVGATASTLLECDEAQDVLIAKWDKEIAPMAASTNATRVFWGTAWTSRTLLARELRAAREAERRDGQRRVFVLDAGQVAAEVSAYGEFVAEEVRRHGRQHPFVKTQYFSEEIDQEGGMFPPRRTALMRGDHPAREAPEPDQVYAFLLDVAGEDEGAAAGEDGAESLAYPQRDSTALTIVEVDLSSLSDQLLQAPTYRVVGRRCWTGVRHTALYGQLRALIDAWDPRCIVVDATGVGAGLCSFLDAAYPHRVLPFQFNTASKSRLGWDFLSVIESGRYREHRPSPVYAQEQALFWRELSFCQMEIIPGPERRMRWGVPAGTRDPASGELVHDDLVLSAALVSALEGQPWGLGDSTLNPAPDPLHGMRDIF